MKREKCWRKSEKTPTEEKKKGKKLREELRGRRNTVKCNEKAKERLRCAGRKAESENMKNEWGGGSYTMDAGGRETDAEEEEEEQEEELALTCVLVSTVGE